MINFRIGDIVECVDEQRVNSHVLNKKGKIIYIRDYTPAENTLKIITVEFFENVNGHNDCAGKQGHVWNLDSTSLRKIKRYI